MRRNLWQHHGAVNEIPYSVASVKPVFAVPLLSAKFRVLSAVLP